MVSALPQRSENSHHVSMIENYPATLEVLGEPIRQVRIHFPVIKNTGLHFKNKTTSLKSGTLPSVGRGSGSKNILQGSPPSRLPV